MIITINRKVRRKKKNKWIIEDDLIEKSNSLQAGIWDGHNPCVFIFLLFSIGPVNKYRHGSEIRYAQDIMTFDLKEEEKKKTNNKKVK